MSASELLSFYHQNEVRADAALKSRRLGVVATVESINKDFLDQPYLVLEGGDNMFEHVQASFSDKHLSELMNIQKGQAIRISCEVGGEVLGSVMLKHCQFEPELAQVAPSSQHYCWHQPLHTPRMAMSDNTHFSKENDDPYLYGEGESSGCTPEEMEQYHRDFQYAAQHWEEEHAVELRTGIYELDSEPKPPAH